MSILSEDLPMAFMITSYCEQRIQADTPFELFRRLC